MTFAPGSLLWLLSHELRLHWRGTHGHRLLRALAILVLVLFLHVVALVFAIAARASELLPRVVSLSGLTLLLTFMVSVSWSRGLILLVQSIYQRGDGDLVLASPIAPATVISARTLGIAVSIAGELALFFLPFANVAMLFGQPRWGWAYLLLPAIALLVTALSVLLSRFMFRFIGPRGTRALAQIAAALIASAVAVLWQLPLMWLGERPKSLSALWLLIEHWPSESHPVWWPARLAMVESGPASLAALLGVVAFYAVSMRVTARGFIADLASASGIGSRVRRKPRLALRRFNTDPRFNLIRKELRVVLRDPWILSQLLQQNIVLLPVGIVVALGPGQFAALGWMAVVMGAISISGALGWLTGAGEDAPDLLRSAPLPARSLKRAKLMAALLPAGGLTAIAMLSLCFQARFYAALGVGVCTSCGALASALLHMRARSQPRPRRELRNRYRGSLLVVLVDTTSMFCFTILACAALYWDR